MKKYIKIPLMIFYYAIFCFVAIATNTATAATNANIIDPQKPEMLHYTKYPAVLSEAEKPSVMLLVDNSGSMNSLAYKPQNGGIVQYNGGSWSWLPVNGTKNNDGSSYEKDFDPKKSLYGLFDSKAYYRYSKARKYFEKCTANTCSESAYPWSGNFLNWLTMRRIDITKKVLTGGNTITKNSTTLLKAEPNVDRDYFIHYDDSTPLLDLNGNIRHVTPFARAFIARSVPRKDPVELSFYRYTTRSSFEYKKLYYTYSRYRLSDRNRVKKFNVMIKLEPEDEPVGGVVQDNASDVRFGLTIFDSGVNDPQGGIVRNYVGASPSKVVNAINKIEANSWTPLAESLYTVVGYFKQDNVYNKKYGPMYYKSGKYYNIGGRWVLKPSYIVNNEWDPFSFNRGKKGRNGDYKKNLKECSKAFVILLTDGLPTMDANISPRYRDDDNDSNDQYIGKSKESDYLDDIAFYAHTTDLRTEAEMSGVQNLTIYPVFAFGDEPEPPQLLIDAAKNGGFEDSNGNGKVDDGEVKYDEKTGLPENLFNARDGQALADALSNALTKIKATTSSGTSVAILNSSTDGSGATFQSKYFPSRTFVDDKNIEKQVLWTGDVQAMLIDSYGNLREDTNNNEQLDMIDDLIVKTKTNDTTKSVIVSKYKDSNGDGILQTSLKEDVNNNGKLDAGEDLNGDGNLTVINENSAELTGLSLDDIKYLWSGGNKLSHLNNAGITEQRPSYISNIGKRYIFTYIDANNNGKVNFGEVLPFTTDSLASTNTYLGYFLGTATKEKNLNFDNDFNEKITTNDLKVLINYIRGHEYDTDTYPGLRSRRYNSRQTPGVAKPLDKDAVWRLGDIVTSSPTAVQKPFAGYDTTYNDITYRQFKRKYSARRTMVYTGSNDGLFHAFNGGFYQDEYYDKNNNVTKNKFWKKCEKNSTTGELTCSDPKNSPDLGMEMWAYIPYNLLPHLQWLPRQDYTHVFYNDLPPATFEAQLWPKQGDAVHVGGWGTLLVGGMRFGGGPIEVDVKKFDGNAKTEDKRIMRSAYFVMDITDPELPPVLLDEFTIDTDARASFSTTQPSLEYVSEKDNTRKWYMVFGTGPNTLKGESVQKGRIFVREFNNLSIGTGQTKATQKYEQLGEWKKAKQGITPDEFHLFEIDEENSFISEFHGSDFQVGNPKVNESLTGAFSTDAIYFGTIAGEYNIANNSDPNQWKGKMHRITVNNSSVIDNWKDKVLFDAQAPISTKPQISLDEEENVWVYFGTGRFFQADYDKEDTDPKMKLYGIKEPMKDDSNYGKIPDYTKTVYTNIMDSTNIEVYAGPTAKTSKVKGATATNFFDLEKGMSQKSGWYITLSGKGERLITNPVIRSQVVNFNTFIPDTDICNATGDGYAYNLFYKTGTAHWKPIIGVGSTYVTVDKKKQYLSTSKIDIGGLSSSSSFHSGASGELIQVIQKGDGSKELPSNNPLGKHKSSRIFWKDAWQ